MTVLADRGPRNVPHCVNVGIWSFVPARSRTKFSDPEITATGERRAGVQLKKLETVWFNTGTLCNLTCDNCFIELSPRNDRLVYLTLAEVRRFLDEAKARTPCPSEIGFTGGEPFINPEFWACWMRA